MHTGCFNGEQPFLFVDINQFPHDVNLVITVLLKTLIKKTAENSGSLHLQFDNTAKENKNKYMLAFCAVLIDIIGHPHVSPGGAYSLPR